MRRPIAFPIALAMLALCLVAAAPFARADARRPAAGHRARTVTLTVRRTTGRRVRFSGTVDHSRRGTRVTIQCRAGARWQTVVSARTLNRAGRYAVTLLIPGDSATDSCRAQVPHRRSFPVATSRTRTVKLPTPTRTPTPTPSPTPTPNPPPAAPIDISECHDPAGGGSVPPATYLACIEIPCDLGNPVNYFSCANEVGEFKNPSWTALPTPSVYNTAPTCPVAIGTPFCSVPLLNAPPPDAGNAEWLTRDKNPDGTWDQNRSGYINSAYWPSELRPDLQVYALPGAADDCASRLWHYCYLSGAQAVGYPLTNTPAVGDLAVYPGECAAFAWNADLSQDTPGANCNPATNTDWFASYVQQINPDGTWQATDAGECIPACQFGAGNQDTAYDSGIVEQLFAPSSDPYTSFIGLMPPGTPQPKAPGG